MSEHLPADQVLAVATAFASLATTVNESKCKGLFFRVRESRFISNGTITLRREFKPLKRMSCKGCGSCEWMFDDLNECGMAFIDDGQNGDIVRLAVLNEKRDWETGYVDNYDLRFLVQK
jgi:NAD-dependent dihydropyrimidine dehydrogenase PreA subunit